MTKGGTRSLFAGVLRLVPYSGIQFCDVHVSDETAADLTSRFTEEIFESDGIPHRILLPLDGRIAQSTLAPDAEAAVQTAPRIVHPVTGRPVDPARVLTLDGISALKHFAGRWVPLPYLRFVGRDEHQRPRYDAGPTNWARAWVTPHGDEGPKAITITLAFDTSIERHSRLDAAAYLAPNGDDAAFGSTFICAENVDELGPFIGEPWLEAWLEGGATAAVETTPAAEAEFRHRHVALYLTLLRVLARAGVLPEARFVDTIQRRFPIRTTAVDLILDLGDTETTALLVEVTPGGSERTTSGFAEPLRLRDLSSPGTVYEGPFPTAAEFNVQPFGDAMLSRDSGRQDAFAWPSLVRIGHEARRLSLRNNGTEGVTGLSNLRSFLLDDAASPGLWRQSTDDETGAEQGPMVSGLTLAHIGENGVLLGAEPVDAGRPSLGSVRPAIRPRFSRASMVGFFATELVLHALSQVNASTPDGAGGGENEMRELRQVVVLAPATLNVREREALRARVDAGLVLAWRGLGWDRRAGVPQRPTVILGLGGDLGTQIAFLHDEVCNKYQGRFRDFLRVYRGGDAVGAETLRIASVDFGARTTSLAIVDYAVHDDPLAPSEWEPTVKLSERLPVGTDAAMQALIWSMILPAIERHLETCGLVPARHFLDEITGRSTTSLLIEDPYFTRRFNRKVLWPAARGLFMLDEHGAMSTADGNRAVPLATLVALGGGRLDTVAQAFDRAALQSGAEGFTLAHAEVKLKRGLLARLMTSEMQDTVAQISRVVAAQTCDLLLVGGEGARLPSLRHLVLAALPLSASRIIDLHTHINRTAAAALGPAARLAPATMMPAIAAALERRNSLELGGFGARALRRLGGPVGTEHKPIERSDSQRSEAQPKALAAPDSSFRAVSGQSILISAVPHLVPGKGA